MAVRFVLAPLEGPPPPVTWVWNAETRILIGGFPVPAGDGFTGSVEITGEDGAVVVLDVRNGWLAGLEIVVWPGAEVDPGLTLPAARPGRIGVPGRVSASGIGAQELETFIDADVTPDRRRIHILIGSEDPADTVQVANHLLIELDARGGIAGCWMDAVPPAPGAAA